MKIVEIKCKVIVFSPCQSGPGAFTISVASSVMPESKLLLTYIPEWIIAVSCCGHQILPRVDLDFPEWTWTSQSGPCCSVPERTGSACQRPYRNDCRADDHSHTRSLIDRAHAVLIDCAHVLAVRTSIADVQLVLLRLVDSRSHTLFYTLISEVLYMQISSHHLTRCSLVIVFAVWQLIKFVVLYLVCVITEESKPPDPTLVTLASLPGWFCTSLKLCLYIQGFDLMYNIFL